MERRWQGKGRRAPGRPARKRSARQDRSPDFYYFDLRKIESKRSHGWSKHVGKTPEHLLATIMATARFVVAPNNSLSYERRPKRDF